MLSPLQFGAAHRFNGWDEYDRLEDRLVKGNMTEDSVVVLWKNQGWPSGDPRNEGWTPMDCYKQPRSYGTMKPGYRHVRNAHGLVLTAGDARRVAPSLAKIKHYTELLDSFDPEKLRSYLSPTKGFEGLAALLGLSNFNAGSTPFRMKDDRLKEIISTVQSQIRLELADANAELNTVVSGMKPKKVKLDTKG